MRAVLTVLVLAAAAAQAYAAGKSFTVKGNSILDANGRRFVIRGVNHAHTWFKGDLATVIPAIARAGANTVRVVLSNGAKWQRDDESAVRRIVDLCASHKMAVVLEVHDATGSNSAADLQKAVDYWISVGGSLKGREDRVMINIANEWYSASDDGRQWAAGYKSAITRLRAAGLSHLLVVDAAGWGQHVESVLRHGKEVFAADPLRRTAFSVHMYEVAGATPAVIRANVDGVLALGVPLIVGEFSTAQNGKPVDARYIMAYCARRAVGWLAWSWFGNSAQNKFMDLVTGIGPGARYTAVGRLVVDGPAGLKAASAKGRAAGARGRGSR